MTKAEEIRRLAVHGISRSEIARQVGVRYQHVYNVLKRNPELAQAPRIREAVSDVGSLSSLQPRRELRVAELLQCGFVRTACWVAGEGTYLSTDAPLPVGVGVYAFSSGETVLYVGLASKGVAKRLYFYGRPGSTQRTSLRLNEAIRNELAAGAQIDILTAHPGDFQWNGLRVNGSAGLELGLIETYSLPWNIRGVR